MAHTHALLSAAIAAFISPFLPAQWAGEYLLDETSGTTANDSSPSKNDGTLQNFTGTTHWGPGKFKGALTFDGVDDFVELKTGTNLPIYKGDGRPYTIAFWVKAPVQNDRRVYSEGSGSTNTPLFAIGSGTTNNTHLLRIYIRNSTNRVVCTAHSTATVFDDTWHHVCWVDACGETTLYVDGKRDASSFNYSTRPGTANFGTWGTDKAAIGAIRRANPSHWLTGSIDEFRIYEFAASQADVDLMLIGVPLLPCTGSIGSWGEGCNGSLIMGSGAPPALGKTLHLSLSRGTPGAVAMLVLGTQLKPLDLAAIGFPGCTAYPDLQTSFLLTVGVLDAAGTVSPISLPIPNVAALDCALFPFQGATTMNGQLSLTPAALVHIGR